jgi:hypothetical protein
MLKGLEGGQVERGERQRGSRVCRGATRYAPFAFRVSRFVLGISRVEFRVSGFGGETLA